ncbi:MAG TPA: hypothetical protein P5080_02630 [Candidatus Paceibacterota bacterium]|nr:hypothetical protein [Candidatus Pacearchaeota archaeon]HRZ50864.1 hypothetical protein [Candidatus Paceibacterota bacterium]HSA36585.1 hypothetical protein [Candidatus Paceibacterota bacterium]
MTGRQQRKLIIFSGVVLSGFFSTFLYSCAFTNPPTFAPQQNAPFPLNGSAVGQTKSGPLSLAKLSVDDGDGACCSPYFTVSINELGSSQPTLQFYDFGGAEGQMILKGDIGNGNRGFLFQSTQTALDGRFTGSFFVDGNAGIGSAVPPAKLFIKTSDVTTSPLWIGTASLYIKEGTGFVGIGTTNPGNDRLEVNGRAYASGGWQTTDADYAEWFEKEEEIEIGGLVGVNPDTGKARRWRQYDEFLGIRSAKPGLVGNRTRETDIEMERDHVLVGLIGQVDFNQNQVVFDGRIAKTEDGTYVGILLNSGKLYIGP